MENLFKKKDAGSGSGHSAELAPTESKLYRKSAETKEISWTAYDTNSKKKSADWYFVLWTIALASAVAAILLNNILFGLFLVIAAFAASIYASRKPKLIELSISKKGVRADSLFLPFSQLSYFYIADDNVPMYLLLQSKKALAPLYTLPISEEVNIEDLHTVLSDFLKEEALEVPFHQQIMDRIGF